MLQLKSKLRFILSIMWVSSVVPLSETQSEAINYRDLLLKREAFSDPRMFMSNDPDNFSADVTTFIDLFDQIDTTVVANVNWLIEWWNIAELLWLSYVFWVFATEANTQNTKTKYLALQNYLDLTIWVIRSRRAGTQNLSNFVVPRINGELLSRLPN